MKTTKRLAFSAFLAVSTAGGTALAQEQPFGEDGQFIIGAERLFGLNFVSMYNKDGTSGTETTVSDTRFSLLWPNGSYASLGGPTPYEIPHVGLDYVVASHVTVGGSIGFSTSSGTTKVQQPGLGAAENDSPSTMLFVFQPRAGYALSFSDQFAFWPRGGFTFYDVHQEIQVRQGPINVTQKTTTTGFGLDLEAQFVYTPIPHFGFTGGLVFDIPLAGSTSQERTGQPNPPDDTVHFRNIGLVFGILGYL